MSVETKYFVRIPESLFDDAQSGMISYGMFTVLCWLHRRADWKRGIVGYTSPEIISRWTQGTLTEKAAQRAMHRAELQGYITCGIVRGSTENYPVMIHNYTAIFQEKSGDEMTTSTRVINPREIRTWKEVRAAGSKENRQIIVSMRKSMRLSMNSSMSLSMKEKTQVPADSAECKETKTPAVHEDVHESVHQAVHEDVHISSLSNPVLTKRDLINETSIHLNRGRDRAIESLVPVSSNPTNTNLTREPEIDGPLTSPLNQSDTDIPDAETIIELPESNPCSPQNQVPVPPMNNLPRASEIEKLVKMFLDYQRNPGYNEKGTLLHWHSVLSRLRRTYPFLEAYMKFGFEIDPFWSSGKLIRGKNSKGKGGKKYPDPIDYFEDMLPHIVTNFNRQQKTGASKSAAKQPGVAVNETVGLWDRYRMSRESQMDLENARAYFVAHRKEYEEQHPEWLEDFKFRRIYE